MTDGERAFIERQRVGRLATADVQGAPHVVPVCFLLSGETLYVTIDGKPKRQDVRSLKRLRNIAENPGVAFVVDRYDEDWSRLGWVMLRGRADILASGQEHDDAQGALKSRYRQLVPMDIADLPVIALRIEKVTHWGDLL